MKKKKGLNKKTVTYIAATFGIFLIAGIVFAATTGILTINGFVSRGESVDLDFTTVSCSPLATTTGVPVGDGVTVAGVAGGDYNCGVTLGNAVSANGNNDIFNWGIFLREPGDTQSVVYSIENVGNASAELSAINVSTSTGFGSTPGEIVLSGNGTTVTSQCLDPGDTIGPFTIVTTWPATDTAATGGATFTATLDYAQSASSCP